MPRPAPAPATASAPPGRDPLATGEELALLLALFLVPLVAGTLPEYAVFLRPFPAIPAYWGEVPVFGLILLAWLIRLVRRFRGDAPAFFAIPAIAAPAAAFVGWVFLSAVAGEGRSRAIVELGRIAAGLLVFYLVATLPADARRRSLLALLIGAGLDAVIGVQEYLSVWLGQHNPSWRVFGPFYNPNAFAVFMAMGVFLALGAWRFFKRSWWRITLVCCLLMAAFDVWRTGSRSGILALGAGIAVFLALAVPGRRSLWWRAAVGLAGMAALIGFVVLVPQLRGRFANIFTDNSTVFRAYTWKSTAAMALDTSRGVMRPVYGHGPGTFVVLFPHYAEAGVTKNAHQIFLQTAAESGLIGLGLFLWLLGAVFLTALRRWRRAAGSERLFAAGTLAALTVLLAQGMVDYGWYITGIYLTGWLCFALLSEPPAQPRARLGGWGAAGAITMTIILLYLLALAPVSRAVGSARYNRADAAVQRGDFKGLLDCLREAMRWDPTNERYPLYYAQSVIPFAEQGQGEVRDYARALLPETLRIVGALVQREPYNSEARYVLARVYQASGDADRAIAEYRTALADNPQSAASVIALSDLLLDRQDFSGAAEVLRKYLKLRGTPVETAPALGGQTITEFGEAHYRLGLLALNGKIADDAGAQFQNAMRIVDDYKSHEQPILDPGGTQQRDDTVNHLAARTRWRQGALAERAGNRDQMARLRTEARRLWPEIAQAIALEDAIFERH